MKKILVTGSLGYLGSVLTDYLERNGFECIGYDTGFFRDCLVCDPPATKTILRDARDIEAGDLRGIDALVQLAGISNDPFGNLEPAKVYNPTRQYTFKIAKLCKNNGVRFVFASSCSVYGKGQGELLDEDSPTAPQTPYSLNKLQIEQDLQTIADTSFSPIAFRFATAFGYSPRLRFDLVTNMLVGMAVTSGKIILNSDGTPWPNIHVLDICKSIKCALTSGYNGGKLLVLNVGREDNNLQIIDIARKVQAHVPGCELKFLSDNPELDKEGLVRDRKVNKGVDTRTYKVSFSRICSTFPDFKCDWSVDDGIKDLIGKLESLGFTESQFKNKNFYRLQKIESLHQSRLLSDDLRWTQPQPQAA